MIYLASVRRNKRVGTECETECVNIINDMIKRKRFKGIAYRYVMSKSRFQPIDVLVDGKYYLGIECKDRTVKNSNVKLRYDDISKKGTDDKYQIEHQLDFLDKACRSGLYYFRFHFKEHKDTVRVFIPHTTMIKPLKDGSKTVSVKYILEHGYIYRGDLTELFKYIKSL